MPWRGRFRILARRDLRRVFGATVVSNLGSGIVSVAFAFAVLDLTHSATDLGIVLACRTVAQVSGLLLGGVVADRTSRRRVMMGADLTRLAGQALIGILLVRHQATLVELAASQVILGAAGAFFQPAAAGLLPAVAGDQLQEANALRGIASAASSVIGPLLGALVVVAVGPAWGLLADSLSYGLSALWLRRLTRGVGDAPMPAEGRQTMLSDLRGGFREVTSRTWVWSLILAFAVGNALGGTWDLFGPLATRHWYGGAPTFALLSVLWSAGSLLGGIALLRFKPRRPLLVGTLLCAPFVVPSLMVALRLPVLVIAPFELLAGIGPIAFNTLWWTALQQNVSPEVISRVISYDFAGSYLFIPLGMALAGPLISAIGLAPAMLAYNLAGFVVMMSVLAVRDVRGLRAQPAGADIVSA
ncbi:MFS transporter [Conexibacter sp. DBS9H8]|uniref:MFS transporter n=1 Tax=Conexibacter sp. DBS9H8 TaxID=2937801 RepID=UPI00200EEC11|nr:MFS transporter [Conexibacter sp. DBS9H8]